MEEAAGRAREAAEAISDHERHNRAFWDADAADYQAAHGAELAAAPLAWGTWRIPESELRILGDVRGRDVLEFGCGAAQWSIALAAEGARIVGLDLSLAQLQHVEQRVPLVLASGERAPFPDASFDIVFCDHGVMSFADPNATVPEVARLLRPGGFLAFCQATPLLYMTWNPDTDAQTTTLHRSYFDLGRLDHGEGTIDFVVTHGEWVRLFREHGLIVEDLVELRRPPGATTTYVDFVGPEWAERWPAEQIWKARKGGRP